MQTLSFCFLLHTQTRRVVVTGMGALTPIGLSLHQYWQALQAGTSGSAPITRFDASRLKTRFAAELKGWNAEDHFDKKEARHMDRCCLYALQAAGEALTQAGLAEGATAAGVDPDRVGVIWGSANGGMETFQEGIRDFETSDGPARYNPYFIPKTLVDMASGLISIRFGFTGVNFCPVSACATSNSALVAALHYIRFGYADVIVSGGSDAAITPSGIGGFNACKALSTHNDDPARASRPFDLHRDGFVMGEGAGALVLEEYEHAVRRGATILAEVAGGSMNGDAYHMTATHPDGDGAAKAIRLALADAGLTPEDIDYVNAHATGTPVGDLSELRAIVRVFGEEGASRLSISATKSQTGHLLGAAGAIEAIATVQALRHGIVPPTINTAEVDPNLPLGLDLTLDKAVHKPLRAAVSDTFGFGGHNAILVMKRFEA